MNTVHNVDGRLIGDNTDGYGFYAPLREAGVPVSGRRVIVLGAGGAARAVVLRLAREGAHITLVNRTRARAERLSQDVSAAGYSSVELVDLADAASLYDAIRECEILVQTTRVGMYPHTEDMPAIPLEALTNVHLVYDLVYYPVETVLLQQARRIGCRTMTGVIMLVHQGAAASFRWTGVWPPVDVMEQSVLDGLR